MRTWATTLIRRITTTRTSQTADFKPLSIVLPEMEEVEGSGLPRLLVFPGSLSSWRALIVAEELQVEVQVEVVNLFLWHHLLPGHLALSPLGSLPVLLLPTGRALEGQVGLLSTHLIHSPAISTLHSPSV